MADFPQELLARVRGEVLCAEPLRRHTSFRIGGPADVFVSPAGVDDLSQVLSISHQYEVPVTILGSGTNVLVSDDGIRGCVVQIGKRMGNLEFHDTHVYAEAGCPMPKLAKLAADRGLSGLEFGGGIPGTVGGAVVMNAGAHGGEMSQIVEAIQVVSRSGDAFWLSPEAMAFGYRTSMLQTRRDLTVAAGRFRLTPGDATVVKEHMQAYAKRRKTTQPLGFPSCGSVFQNPPGDFAGRLIEQCGLKGTQVGDAMVSPVHANFIVNTGNAQAKDVLRLISVIRNHVAERFGVHLELEVELLGC